MKIRYCFLSCLMLLFGCLRAWGDVNAADFLPTDGKQDVSDALQKLIDSNPNQTIYFPDGIYLLSKPVLTPAHPRKSVSLKLADFAVFKAADNYQSKEAMIRLGASHPANDIVTVGSNYSFSGGFIDGSGKASGIAIEGGRETVVRNVSIKNTVIGLHIKRGVNSGSSDADIQQVNIVGTGKVDSIGVLIDGYDNTLTNMRIARVHTGVKINSGGNSLRNIHPLYVYNKYVDDKTYLSSVAFDCRRDNWYDYCYSDQFATGFVIRDSSPGVFSRCFCFWYSDRGGHRVAFRAEGKFNATVTDLKVSFSGKTFNALLLEKNPGGYGKFVRPLFDRKLDRTGHYKKYQ